MKDHAQIDVCEEFEILKEMDFFNHAGVAPITASAGRAMEAYVKQAQGRSYVHSGWYKRSAQVKEIAARLIGAKSGGEIAYVANTSTGLSLVAKGFPFKPGDNVVITGVEYPANRYPWEDLKRAGVHVIQVPQQPDGRIDTDDVIEAITNRTRIVSVSHVQYASGYRMDVEAIGRMTHKAGGYLCVDAIQSVGVLPVDVQGMGIDFLSADGHKWMLSPEGAGIFYCKEDLCEMLHPNVVGWMNMVDASNYGDYRFEFQKDARRFEPGSYNIPGILGMGASLEVLLKVGVDEVWRRVEALNAVLCEGLERKGYRVFSPRKTQGERSGIVVFEPLSEKMRTVAGMQKIVGDLKKENVVIVIREGRLRVSAHFYNAVGQIEKLVGLLPEGR
jgi:cysteine desulfurase / selenocysteine lyase